jgi:hypothetical protein
MPFTEPYDPYALGNLGDVIIGEPPELHPGEPIADGVGGRFLYSWTKPPEVIFMGWLLNGEYDPPPQYQGVQLRAFYRRVPDWAPESPGADYIWTTVSIVRPGGWSSEIQC